MDHYFDHIDAYLEGSLEGEMLWTFERELSRNKTLQEALENHKWAREVSLAFVEEEVRQVLESGVGDEKADVHGKGPSVRRWMAWAAVIFLLIMGVYYLWHHTRMDVGDKTFAELYEEPEWPDTRGEDTPLVKAIKRARSGDVKLGLQGLRSLDTTVAVKNYWLSEVFLKAEMADSVLYYLPQPGAERNRRDRIFYIEILAYKLKGDGKKIRQLIKQLPEDWDRWYWDRIH